MDASRIYIKHWFVKTLGMEHMCANSIRQVHCHHGNEQLVNWQRGNELYGFRNIATFVALLIPSWTNTIIDGYLQGSYAESEC